MSEYLKTDDEDIKELIQAAHEAVEDEMTDLPEQDNVSDEAAEETVETAEEVAEYTTEEAEEEAAGEAAPSGTDGSKAKKFDLKALFAKIKIFFTGKPGGYASNVNIPARDQLGTKIIVMLAVLAVLFTAICLFNMTSVKKIQNKQLTLTEEGIPLMRIGTDINDQLHSLRNGMSRYILVGDAATRKTSYDEYYHAYVEVQESIRELNKQTKAIGDEALIATSSEFEEMISQIAKHTYNEMTLTTAGYFDQAYTDFLELDPVFARSEELVEQINKYTNDILEDSQNYVNSRVTSMKLFMNISMVVYVILIAVAIVFVIRLFVRPSKEACGHVRAIINDIDNGEGNLTDRLEVGHEDEIGQLAIGINGFIEKLQGIMQKMKNNAEELIVSVDKCSGAIRNSNASADDISATLEELAAGMEEVSSTVTQLLADSDSIRKSTKDMTEEAVSSRKMVDEIKERAVRVNSEIKTNKQNAETVLDEISRTLKNAVEESANVSRINALTEEILQIASQTNLLSLNASIEAARAGEAGRGFAVVAEEIRNLADSSKQTAAGIREISEIVKNAVAQLSDTSNRLLGYVQSDVMRDYEGFVDFADQYRGDADDMNKIFAGFAESLEGVSRTMEGMVESIDSISQTIEASSQGVSDAAGSANALVGEFTGITEAVNNNRTISEGLAEEVGRFKQV